MHSTPKWLTRAGAVLVMLAFFLPAVSCTVLSTRAASYSLYTLASSPVQPQSFLFLVPLGALGALLVGFIAGRDRRENLWLLLIQAAGLGLGVFSAVASLAMFASQLSQLGAGLSPDLGLFLLVLGYGMAAVGIVLEFVADQRKPLPASPPAVAVEQRKIPAQAFPKPSAAHLDLIKGDAPQRVMISGNDFQIGRGHRNDLVLSDRVASASHVRLRCAQGSWFIQDQNSSNGTFVNGKRVAAQRLKDGDEILIGKTAFIFHK